MESSRLGTVIMAFPLVILILALVVALYNVGFDMGAATLPKNPVGPLNESLSYLLQADSQLITGSAVESDMVAGTVILTGKVHNPTAYPLTVRNIEYRVFGEEGNVTASLAEPVKVPPGDYIPVVLVGNVTKEVIFAIKSGGEGGTLSAEIEIMGIRITTELISPWKVDA